MFFIVFLHSSTEVFLIQNLLVIGVPASMLLGLTSGRIQQTDRLRTLPQVTATLHRFKADVYIGKNNKLRILAKPRYNSNPHIADLYRHMGDLGDTIHSASIPRLLSGSYDVLHIHWPDRVFYWATPRYVSVTLLYLFLLLSKMRGMKIVYTCHNFFPKNKVSRYLLRYYFFTLRKHVDLVISPRKDLSTRIKSVFNKAEVIFLPLGLSEPVADLDTNIIDSLDLAELKGSYAFIPGIQEETKKTEVCLQRLRELKAGLTIVICGRFPDRKYLAFLKEQFKDDPLIKIFDRFLSPSELSSLISNSAFVVASQVSGTNSGIALLSVSHSKPCFCATHVVANSVRKDYGSDLTWHLEAVSSIEVWSRISSARSNADLLTKFSLKNTAYETHAALERVVKNTRSSLYIG